jgi:ribosomal protein S18 acetylase RimI-like enzyme
MAERGISIRPAKINDAELIARVVAFAIGDAETLQSYCGENYLCVLTEVAAQEETLYSWCHTLVAEVDGSVAGAIIGYDGALLKELHRKTFAVINELTGLTPTLPNETEAGEYYLDSVAVLPEFRNIGVGRVLIESLYRRAKSEGHSRFGLIVDHDNPAAERLYINLGFTRVGVKEFFGHQMWHLQRKVK